MIIADILDQSGITESAEGVEITRVYHVTEIAGAANQIVPNVLRVAGLPVIGEPHPAIAGAIVTNRAVSFNDPENATVVVTYTTPARLNTDGGLNTDGVSVLDVEFSASTFQEETTRDAFGDLMIARKYGFADETGYGIAIDYVVAEILRPQALVRVRHTRPTLPKDLVKRYVGATNADPWGGEPAESWLCTNFSTQREAGQIVCTFEALFKPESWRLPHVMQKNGVPLVTSRVKFTSFFRPATDSGLGSFQIYPTLPFSALGIAW